MKSISVLCEKWLGNEEHSGMVGSPTIGLVR